MKTFQNNFVKKNSKETLIGLKKKENYNGRNIYANRIEREGEDWENTEKLITPRNIMESSEGNIKVYLNSKNNILLEDLKNENMKYIYHEEFLKNIFCGNLRKFQSIDMGINEKIMKHVIIGIEYENIFLYKTITHSEGMGVILKKDNDDWIQYNKHNVPFDINMKSQYNLSIMKGTVNKENDFMYWMLNKSGMYKAISIKNSNLSLSRIYRKEELMNMNPNQLENEFHNEFWKDEYAIMDDKLIRTGDFIKCNNEIEKYDIKKMENNLMETIKKFKN